MATVLACKNASKTIGLVPTMGALHEGHASLVRRAVNENNVCFVSVFVNPTQFNNKEDLAKYPRNIRRDAELLSSIGADFVFAPTPEEMYSAEEMNCTFSFDFNGLDQVMEGKMRPGHFNGVVQVVSRLFYLVKPDKAYFGEKDFQQLAIIHYMVERSELAGTFGHLQIVDCPIVREPSGLALSSRNERLSEEEKHTATAISKTLFDSLQWAKEPGATVAQVQQRVIDTINATPFPAPHNDSTPNPQDNNKDCTPNPQDNNNHCTPNPQNNNNHCTPNPQNNNNDGNKRALEVEYYEIVDRKTLLPTDTFTNAIGCVTVYCGPVRLIDNIQYN